MTERQITGRHVFLGFAAAFGLIIAVNVFMAFNAIKTFPGLEVKNSYVASQEFNVRKAAQEALGWTVTAVHLKGTLYLNINDENGNPVVPKELHAVVGRATSIAEDVEPAFSFDGRAHVAQLELADGNWNIRMNAIAEDGTEFTQRVILHVK
ncbi:FixH family protein [Thalassovita sp.]|jgi:nitrogen fixation protein FixH|uniref:FixH family protein n=1 Tax=Thalassovita sp. TaxID=1979401 RepID=UPI003B5B1AB0